MFRSFSIAWSSSLIVAAALSANVNVAAADPPPAEPGVQVPGTPAGAIGVVVEAPPPLPAPLPQPAASGIIHGPIFQQFVPAGALPIAGAFGGAETGKFWFGMMCLPAPEVVRAQLALPVGTGLVVQEVVPDGPAAKAGVQRHDVLLMADGKPLPDSAALARISNEKATPAVVEFKLLRGGKEQTLKATPVERPAQPFNVFIPQADDPQALEKAIEHLRKMAAERQAAGPGRPLRLRILRPGQVPGPAAQQPFPADMRVQVTRDGNNPWKIEVQQGDQNWQITSDDLAKLPETIRPHIEGMLGNMGAARAAGKPGVVEGFAVPEVEIPVRPEEAAKSEPATPAQTQTAPPPAKDRGAEIDQLREQLKNLQRKLDQLDEGKK